MRKLVAELSYHLIFLESRQSNDLRFEALRPFPTPARRLHFFSQCCGCNFPGVGVIAAGARIGKSNAEGLVPC